MARSLGPLLLVTIRSSACVPFKPIERRLKANALMHDFNLSEKFKWFKMRVNYFKIFDRCTKEYQR